MQIRTLDDAGRRGGVPGGVGGALGLRGAHQVVTVVTGEHGHALVLGSLRRVHLPVSGRRQGTAV